MELYWSQILWKIWCSPEAWGVERTQNDPLENLERTREKCFDITPRGKAA